MAEPAGGPAAPEWRPLREFRREELTLDTYRELARAQEPFAVVDAADQFPAAAQWADVSYIAARPGIDADAEEAELQFHPAPFALNDADSGDVPLSQALQLLQVPEAGAAAEPPAQPMYVKWGFAHKQQLIEELPMQQFFCTQARPPEPADNPLLVRPGKFYCWVYAGQAGSGSKSHTDVMNSAAWLTLLRGKKDWVLAHGADVDKVSLESGARADLFALAERWGADDELRRAVPGAPSARLYRYTQRPGCAVFVPSLCSHAVRNLEYGVSVTHNFVDGAAQPHWEAALKEMVGS